MSDVGDIRMQSVVGERIKRLRNGALMTQDDLAAAAGVSTDLIRKLEPPVEPNSRAVLPAAVRSH